MLSLAVSMLLFTSSDSHAGIRYVYVIVKPQYLLNKEFKTVLRAHFPSGAYSISEPDLVVAARGIPMVWERFYRSNVMRKVISGWEIQWNYTEPGPSYMGYGWTNGWMVRIEGNAYINGQGKVIYFQKDNNDNFITNMEEGLSLKKTATGYELIEIGRYTYTFDATGKLQTVRDKRGNSAVLGYDADGRLTTITDATGRQAFNLNYNADGHISSVTDIAGRTITYDYDAFGNLSKVRRNGDLRASYTYNANHGVISKTNALNETWSIDYYPKLLDKGVVKRILDPVGTELLKQGLSTTGHETSFVYDFDGKVFYTTDYNGSVFVKMVDNNGQVVSVEEIKNGKRIPVSKISYNGRTVTTTDAQGNQTIVQSDEWGNIIKQTDGEGGEKRSSYTTANKLLSATDQLGNVTRNEYDANGNLIKTTWAVGKPEESVTTYSYDSHGQVTSETTGGATKSATYNDQGLPATITDPEGNTVAYEYNGAGSVTSYTDQVGNKTLYSYDTNGNLLTKTDPLGNVTSYAYNAASRLTSMTDPLGRVTRYETDFKGRISALIDPLGNRTEYAYDGNGNRTKITRGDSVVTMTYDSSNHMTGITDPEGNTTSYGYAPSGCASCGATTESVRTITDPLGNTLNYNYDKAMRVTGITDPMSNITKLERDAAGQITARIDANNNSTKYQNDAFKRPIQQTDANNNTIQFSYDNWGNLASLTDQSGNTTIFEYDKNNRLTKETRPMGQTTEYTYYPNGMPKAAKDGKGQITTYTYDKNSRLTEVTYADGSKDSFQYNAVGNLTSYTSPGISGTIQYDELNRRTSETVNYGTFTKTYSYSYDVKGNKQSYTSPEGTQYNYAYNKNNQLKTITYNNQAISFDYQWNRLIKAIYPNGTTTTYDFNANSWLTNREAKKDGTTLESGGYRFDKVGNITGITTQDNNYIYGYDSIFQITQATGLISTEAFSYDKNGNRMNSGYSHNANNELLTTDRATYTYDNNGNTITKTEIGYTTTYSYNARNRLSKVTLPEGTEISYAYDPFGRRIKKQTPTDTTYYLYANEGLIGEYSEAGTIKKANGWRPNSIWSTNPLFQVDNGSYYYYHNDHLGTPRKLTDANGATVWLAEYGVFGMAQVDSTSTITNNLRFPGQYYDEETGLYYNWNRYYDPEAGRYTQKDPIGFGGGDVNYFRYVQNNPVNLIDPTGLDWFRPIADPYVVGRRGSRLVAPGKGIGKFIDDYIPAGHTFGTIHDEVVDTLHHGGLPDLMINIPTMPIMYMLAIIAELDNSINKLKGKKPLSVCH